MAEFQFILLVLSLGWSWYFHSWTSPCVISFLCMSCGVLHPLHVL